MHNKIVTILHLTLIFFVIFTLAPLQKATAYETTGAGGAAGLTLSWDIEFTDVAPRYTREIDCGFANGCMASYVSFQLVPFSTLHLNVSSGPLPLFNGLQNASLAICTDFTCEHQVAGAQCKDAECEGGLSVSASFTVTQPHPSDSTLWQWGAAVRLSADVAQSVPGVLVLDIFAENNRSSQITDNPEKKGGPADNISTEFDGVCPIGSNGYGLPSYAVNTSTLNLVAQDTDFSYRGLGPDIAFTRTWNADPSASGMFGRGWGFSYESTIVKSCIGASVKKGSGQEILYLADLCPSSNSLIYPVSTTPPAGTLDKLTYMEGDYWLLEEKETRLTYRYNLKGSSEYRLTSITDRNGNTVRISYNTDNSISSVTDAAGRVTTFAYDPSKRCVSMTVPDGRQATYTYDASGNMIRNTDLLGTEITYTYDADSYMSSMSFAGKTTTFTYDTNGGWKHVDTIVDANGNTKRYTASSETSTSITDSAGGITAYTNEGGRTTGITNPLKHTVSKTYISDLGLPDSSTDANGSVTRMEYDNRGNPVKYTNALGHIVTYAYDANSNLTGKTDPLHKAWTYLHDASSNLVKSISPAGRETAYSYDAKGQLINLKDASSKATSFTYDDFGNIKTITDANGKTTTMGYDSFGFNRASRTDPLGNITTFTYDNNGRLTKITYPDNKSKSFTYDACAVISITDENGDTKTYEYNNLLSLTKIIDPLGKNISMRYDANNRMTGTTDANAQTITMAYDAAGRQIQMKNASGGTIDKIYDANDNLLILKDEQSKETSFTYDSNNLKLSTVDPHNKSITYIRDALGRITKKTNPGGDSITYTYDDDGRLNGKSFSGGGSITYGYDGVGSLKTVVDSTGTTGYTYDNVNRIASISYPGGLSLSFTYDDSGNKSSVVYPGGLVVFYAYDNRGRVSSVTWGTDNSLTYTHSPGGNITKTIRSNGTETNYTYDANGRVVAIEHKKDSQVFAGMEYRRDSIGRTVEEIYTLPVTHNLTDASLSATYNDVNQIATWGSDAYTYSSDGNVTAIAGDTSFSAVYDPENRPTSLILNSVVATYYTYNGLGMRTKAASGALTRNFHHDATGRLMFETDENGTVVTYYIYSGNLLSAMLPTGGGKLFYHFNKTGNTIALTDGSGNIASAYVYEPFGKVSNKTGNTPNSFTYVGALGVMDEGNGLYFMRNRYYDSSTGRFLQKDPIGQVGGVNLYRYAGNNPIEGIDPEGLLDFNAAGSLAEAAGCGPGSTCAQFLREGFEVTKTMANKAPGRLGNLVYKMKSLTIDAGPALRRGSEFFNTWIRPNMGRAVAAASEVTSVGCLAAVYGTVAAWETGGAALKGVAWMTGSEDIGLAGDAVIEAPVEAFVEGVNIAKRVKNNTYYFWRGLNEKIFGSSESEDEE